jgi:hypothetical protein
MLGHSLMYFVKFSDALREKMQASRGFELAPFPRPLAATLRGFAFYLALPISSIRGCRG